MFPLPESTPWTLAALLARRALWLGWLSLVCLSPLPWARLSESPTAPVSAATPEANCHTDDGSAAVDRPRHLKRLGADRWHAAGHRGQGVKVAILDSGFSGYRAQLGKALPAEVKVRSFRADGNLEARDSQHGILCAEVIHAIAPEAELLLANWEANNPAQFLEAVRWARREGARVLSCSLIMPSWSDAEGNGPVHEGLRKLLGDGTGREDPLCFVCAGNTAERHWSGAYDAGTDGLHQWRPGVSDNTVRPWGSERVSVELCGVQGADFEVTVVDQTADETVGRALAKADSIQRCGAVRFYPTAGHSYCVRLRRVAGAAGRFHLFVLGAGLDHASAHGSICFPGDSPDVVTVGAVDHEDERVGYSSCGPNSKRPKPDLVAPVPFVSSWRARPFAGTSAATPQAAGLAALVWSRSPDFSAQDVRGLLRRSALDLGPQGHDFETGHGRATLPAPR